MIMKRTTTFNHEDAGGASGSSMMRRTSVFIAAVLFFAAHSGTATQGPGSAPQEIRLWPGKAPGTETWTVAETATTSPAGDRTIANVSDPSATVFFPSPPVAT
jgi:hypothetical protein